MAADDPLQRILRDPSAMRALASEVYNYMRDDEVIKRLEAQSEEIRQLREAVKNLTDTVAVHNQAIARLEKAVERHEEALARLEKAVQENSQAIARLEKAVERHEEALSRLEAAVLQNSNDIARLERAVTKLETVVGGFTNRVGRKMEKTIMMLYKESLELHGIDPSRVKHGKFVDETGVIAKGRAFEVDFYETNDYVYVFEVKNLADEGALEQILNRKKLVPHIFNKPVKLFVIANFVDRRTKEEMEKEGVIVISPTVVD